MTIGIFDIQFITTGKLPRELSKKLHHAFDDRQEFDYKDLVHIEKRDAEEILADADFFISSIREYINRLPT